jgi:hypothetical protein
MNFKKLFILFSVVLNSLNAQIGINIVDIKDEKTEAQKEPIQLAAKDISEEWKQEVTKQFELDVAKIKQIIVDGEKSKQDLKDFLNRFDDQRQWFDTNVSATKNFFDPTYNAVMQKKLSFKRLVKAQERAEEILKELADEDKLGVEVRRQIKLAILYNLNSLIQKEVERGRAELGDSGLSDFDIRRVVTRVFSEIEKKRAEEHEIERIVKKDIDALEKQIGSLKKNVEQQKGEKEQLEVKLSNVETELVQKRKANKELENLLKKVEEDKEMLRDEIARRTAFQIRKELKPVIERKNRENMELQFKLKKLEQDLKVLKSDMSSVRSMPKKISNQVQKNEQKDFSKSEPILKNSIRQEPKVAPVKIGQ